MGHTDTNCQEFKSAARNHVFHGSNNMVLHLPVLALPLQKLQKILPLFKVKILLGSFSQKACSAEVDILRAYIKIACSEANANAAPLRSGGCGRVSVVAIFVQRGLGLHGIFFRAHDTIRRLERRGM